ncbi:MAG TPA: hypothetical protein DCQ30_08905 [Acidimicrobiaceae bacterium]|nr:hypothetical protein [Acidimicrobiaceae bacterium]
MRIQTLVNGKKRYVAAGLVAATLGGGAFAFANSLNVTSNTLAAGSKAVASCQSSATVKYTTAWDATNTQFDVASVEVDTPEVSSAYPCANMDVDAVLTGTGNTPTAGTLPDDLGHQTLNSSGSYTWSLSTTGTSAVAASAVTGVQVAITG